MIRDMLRGTCRLALVPGLIVAAPLAARPAEAWREVFQSSPAAYAPLPPGMLAEAARMYKLPIKVIEASATPKPATGTLRFRFAVSAGGTQVRMRLSNEEGSTPLTIAAASLGLAGTGFDAVPGSLRALTFGGRPGTTIPAGAPVLSDPVPIATRPGTALLASVATPDMVTLDPRGGATIAVAAADRTMSGPFAGYRPMAGRPIVTGAEVLSARPPGVIVTLGDSITDGNRTDAAALHGWPAELAARLAARGDRQRHAVVNAGIGGNQLIGGGWGSAALARFDRDVLRLEGVSHVVILEGTNDIGMSGRSIFANSPPVGAADLIGAYRQLIDRAHARGVKVILCTILPFGAAPSHYSVDKEQVRQAVNAWIRSSHAADGVIDFDALARDPAKPVDMRKDFGSVDGLHPGDKGYKAMGDAIDLTLFD